MSRSMWILAAVLAAFAVAMIYQESTGGLDRPWMKCKESMVQQILSNECTPRTGAFQRPDDTTTDGAEPPLDDGVTPVDRGN